MMSDQRGGKLPAKTSENLFFLPFHGEIARGGEEVRGAAVDYINTFFPPARQRSDVSRVVLSLFIFV